ncbi:hypothetical protein VP1G_07703 [Cytospora mali]|uniref:Fibronectin type-III domain-containing protein n=1 Tax=Cytospora mali TaxID=578113 RepID=A0A194V9F4_CYTMA|nr:hypothetical protein VP1G_07703 [Valsa mali var. pyri (nom. inval.)]
MLWIPWTAILPILTLVFLFIAWLIERKGAYVHITVGLCCIFIYAAAFVDFPDLSPNTLYMTAISHVDLDHLDKFTGDNATMVLFSFAAIWLLRRAIQTLWKPVPELINILGVDVPDPPDVMLAYIGIDKATVNWARPHPSKPVQKFLIRVNGVVVGESPANQETAITVTGLKPSHFYNISVIAVGSNSFQAGSKNIRIRTHDPHGRPQLGNSRLPPNFEPEEQSSYAQGEHGDENGAPRSPVPGIETATILDGGPTLAREPSTAGSISRRNTVGRRHSPSLGSVDHKSMRKDSTSEAEVRELGERFQGIKHEIEDTVALIMKEEEDNKRLVDELEHEKQQKKAEQKKKEEQTEKLKKEMGTTERAMRSTVQRRGQLEKELKAKQAERSRYQDNVNKMEKQIQEWRKEKESFEEQKKTIEEEGRAKMATLRDSNEKLQVECSQLETDLKSKREQVKVLEDERKKLPGGEDDEEWRQNNLEKRREWQRREREWTMKLYNESKRGKELDDSLNSIHAQLQQIPQAAFALYNQAQANTTGAEFDTSSQDQVKRRSHHSNSLSNVVMSPTPQYAALDPPPHHHGFSATRPPPGFAPGPFIDLSVDNDMDDDELRALMAGAPLSPSAAALLPSNIFTDDEHDEDDDDYEPSSPVSHPAPTSPFVPMQTASPGHDPQSPTSARSGSLFSSPQGSQQHLPFPPFPSNDESERRSVNSGYFSSPAPAHGQPATHKLANLFSFQRGKPQNGLDEPPQLGSLKHGQSQSFPRQDEFDGVPNKRRISLSNWNVFNRNSVGPDTMDTYASPGGTRGFSARSLLPFGGSRALTGVFDREQGSSRPASIASSEIPRPSTDSGSHLWPPASEQQSFSRSRLVWSPENNTWSRNPSRRPSIGGSPSALQTTLASADDEILDEEDLMNPQVSPSQVGVIGSRPMKKNLPKLNPAAPSFMANIFSSKDKAKSREKDRARDDAPPTSSGNDSIADKSDSRLSLSIRSRTSISESHDSLSLDYSFSNTPSDPTYSLKELSASASPDNVVRKILRQSSKFSLSSRLGGSKKAPGPGSTTGSERERRPSFGGSDVADNVGGEDLLGKSFDSVNSSPSIGPSKSKENRMSGTAARWFSMGKKKEKASLELERERSAETETPTEEQASTRI